MEFENIAAELKKLEESLWAAETRYNRDYMEKILAPDFFEFGRSGNIYTRQQSLDAQGGEIRAELRDFKVTAVREDVFLVTYVSEMQVEGKLLTGNRSSLWVRDGERWRLKFHQGTKV